MTTPRIEAVAVDGAPIGDVVPVAGYVLTREKAQRVVSQLAKGIPASSVCERVGVPYEVVAGLRKAFGPDLGKLGHAALELTQVDSPATRTLATLTPAAAGSSVDALLAEAAAIGDLAKPYAAARNALDVLKAALDARKAQQRALVEAKAVEEELRRLDETRAELLRKHAALVGKPTKPTSPLGRPARRPVRSAVA